VRVRAAIDGDRAAVLALGVAEEAAWFGESELSAEEVGEWIDEEGGMAAGVVAVDGDGRVRGFASPGRQEAVLLADPAETDALTDVLLPWLRVQRDGVQLMAFAGDAARVAAFERHGLRHRRSSFLMARPRSAEPMPAPRFPAGVTVAPYRFGEADEVVHRLIFVDAAWASVPGHVERDLDAWREKERPWRSLFLARRDGRPVGWVAGRLLASGRGYISALAVATSERGRGLGRALLLRAVADLQRGGARDVTLGVEAQNERALSLYRSVDFVVEREWRVYATPSKSNANLPRPT
jgi:ribosomal protein S18 acetylase RimI-like enzyme